MADRTMVFGDDGSISADLAWLWINCHPWPQWRIEVVAAVMPSLDRVSTEGSELHEWQPANPRRAFSDSRIDEVIHLTCELDPRLALSRSADLLVIGPRGPGLAKAMHLGSTAEWLMIHPPAPMLVVRHGRRTQTVVICHDGSPDARAATDVVCRMPWVDQLIVTIVGVDDGRAAVEEAVEAASVPLTAVGADVRHEILCGVPTVELLRHLEQNNPDLVVLGTRGLTGLPRLRRGSTAGVLAHATQSSVLLASDQAADEKTGLGVGNGE